MEPTNICATAPPRFPHPAARALAVPATSLVNMVHVQYWHVTKALPPIPVTNRSTLSPAAVLTNPVNIVGTPQMNNTAALIHRAPKISQNNPAIHRVTTAPATLHILEVQICSFVKSKDVCTSPNSGVTENHAKKAKKKAIHAK
mmetsp:Transcript_26303/g.47387  ORF Transcript_26303/g.47387 Transcript_26303/m.47387 type:complete len:144 (-) Transcript_26303:498-929(-)